MHANQFSEQTTSAKVIHCLKQVSMHQETKEILYLANSDDILEMLLDLQMITLYPKVLTIVKKNPVLKSQIKTMTGE